MTPFAPTRKLLAGGLSLLVELKMPLGLVERPVDR
jgi:hypothetical protein